MEAAALSGPPAWLERIVLFAIPPAAREAVAGDLWETYRTPRQYAGEALRTVPLVIASQMRRNLNLPALMLQSALIFIYLGGQAAIALLPALMLRDAYQATARPSPRRAFRDSILLATGVTILLLQISVRFPPGVRSGLDSFAWLSLFLQALLLSPFLCLFRAGLIMQGDRKALVAASDLPLEELARNYCDFTREVRRRNLLQAVMLALAAACAFVFAWNVMLAGLFLLVAFFLLLDTAPFPVGCDFVSLRGRYQQALARQQQLRRFLRWLWFAPALMYLQARLIESSLAAGRPVAAMLGSIAVVILCFLVMALNREHGGRIQEEIGALDRMRETMTPAVG